nr:PREDICTED: regulator of G-protein signaling 22 [Latimeria chalumnae]|eukprot:XP_014343548.1 PREDICTED: regulator of G-protein signaling 22 [Latimeria chalumnae]
MQKKKLTTEPPKITEDNFEDFLATDNLLVDYFNAFLSLPTFPEPIKFNTETGVFEVINDAKKVLNNRIKAILKAHKPPNPIYNVTRNATLQLSQRDPQDFSIDTNFSVMCLDREQGIQWVKRERLPVFLESDCYFEYRLAKLLSQIEWSSTGTSIHIDPTFNPWNAKREQIQTPLTDDENEVLMKKFYISLGQASVTQTKEWFTLAKQSQQINTTQSLNGPLCYVQNHGHFSAHLERSTLCAKNSNSQGIGLEEDMHSPLSNEQYLNNYHHTQTKRPEYATKSKERPKSTDENFYASIPDSPSNAANTVFVKHKCEHGIESDEERKSTVNKELESLAVDETKQAETDEWKNKNQGVPQFQTLEAFATAFVTSLLKTVISKLTGKPDPDGVPRLEHYKLSSVIICDLSSNEHFDSLYSQQVSQSVSQSKGYSCKENNAKGQDSTDSMEEGSKASESNTDDEDNGEAQFTNHWNYDLSRKKGFEKFKTFINGSSGEKFWWLWIDIERLKVIKDTGSGKRHLNKMKSIYLLRSGEHFLSHEILSRLCLLHAAFWTAQHLFHIQPDVVKPLLLYWGPRYCTTLAAKSQNASAQLKLWHERQLRPRISVEPCPQVITLLPLRPRSCLPRRSLSAPQALVGAVEKCALDVCEVLDTSIIVVVEYVSTIVIMQNGIFQQENTGSKCSTVLGGSRMEKMLQALHHDNQAGYFFMKFCERSGNKILKHSVHFWFDLQNYHKLFYQETLHPFEICRQAQFIHASYIAPGSSMDIGLDQIVKKQIYQKLDPPFEDLFDPAEEYILTLLLVPWVQMTELDRSVYKKVELVKETRQLDSLYYKKLQALKSEIVPKKDEDLPPEPSIPPPSEIPKEPNLWDQVPEEYNKYNLNILIRNRLELEYFRNFLEENFASMDLMCWTDIEQFRRMPHKEKEKREEKSKDIKGKYLNRKYFFGPSSPATKDQQEQVMRLGGGWGKILHDRLSSKVLIEVQKYVKQRIEKKWLPLFLARQDFAERQRMKARMQDVAEDHMFQKNRKKREVWKHLDNKWVSSSKEIIAFRKALLNQVTAHQFQRYVSLKGDYMENGVLFWLEVQKYKDLCHSHSDDATIQNKVTTIINCFINSSIPPALQIDIPPEQAETILERRRELGPYIFREAQMTIFGVLFKLWPGFCDFRNNLADEKILSTLERKKEKKLEKWRRRMKEEEMAAKQQEDTQMNAIFSDNFDDDSENSYSGSQLGGLPSGKDETAYERTRYVSWSYSKYMEALEKERMLLNIESDREAKSDISSFSTGKDLKLRRKWIYVDSGKHMNTSVLFFKSTVIEETARKPKIAKYKLPSSTKMG